VDEAGPVPATTRHAESESVSRLIQTQRTRQRASPFLYSSTSIRAWYPECAGRFSGERRTLRRCQNRADFATTGTLRPLTRSSTDRTRSPSVSRIWRSILRLIAESPVALAFESSLFRAVAMGFSTGHDGELPACRNARPASTLDNQVLPQGHGPGADVRPGGGGPGEHPGDRLRGRKDQREERGLTAAGPPRSQDRA